MDGIELISSSIHLLCDSSYFWFKIKFVYEFKKH